ncbi:hypothetical protein Glove_267g33 [Diversispora epigaea]|uniref:Protein kinase domain-containing protein n=1 Tax=Diversispora epigaea TaxID=1348612 RepID=A0A397I5C6_9GLOM|nr:hypothetical protein Glove_267g33 [Diversispora epigaea]
MATQKIVWNTKFKSIWDKSFYTIDFNIHKTITEQEKHRKNVIENESSLTENEKRLLINEIQKGYDALRIGNNSVEKQQCNNCLNWHQAIQYCEFCIRKYLENNFGKWSSGNNEIDKLIKECQQKATKPDRVIEWIEYDRFENIEHLADGGYATVYTAILKDGCYDKWNSKNQTLERLGKQKIVLKRLNKSNSNVNNVNWFQEVTLSFTLDSTSAFLAAFYGLTKDPETQDYMLVLNYYQTDLKHFLKNNYQSLTLLQKYRIILHVSISLDKIHDQKIMHRDLHSGNILYTDWYISDFGLSGPVDKPINSIYGNLPYIPPEILRQKDYTTKSDVYSLGIIMWEVITGETPFGNHKCNSNSDFAVAIICGYRPKIYKDIPEEYATLMKQCWDAFPDNRPVAYEVYEKMRLLIQSLYNEKNLNTQISKDIKSKISKDTKSKIYRSQSSKVHTFNISIQPRNATDEQQLALSFGKFEFEISEEIQQHFLKSIGAND